MEVSSFPEKLHNILVLFTITVNCGTVLPAGVECVFHFHPLAIRGRMFRKRTVCDINKCKEAQPSIVFDNPTFCFGRDKRSLPSCSLYHYIHAIWSGAKQRLIIEDDLKNVLCISSRNYCCWGSKQDNCCELKGIITPWHYRRSSTTEKLHTQA